MALEEPWALDKTEYHAKAARLAASSFLSGPGVVASGMEVTPHEAANMSVNISGGTLSNGQAWVQGTSSTTQGLYYCFNNATVNVAIGASNPSNPRIDTVVLRVKDADYAGAANEAEFEVVAGTPTSGATLTNLSGAGTVPASCLILAYVLVPASASSITSGDIKSATSSIVPLNPVAKSVLVTGIAAGWPNGEWRSLAVTHGVGFTPKLVFAQIQEGGGIAADFAMGFTGGYGPTAFDVNVQNQSGGAVGGTSMQIAFQAYR